MTLESSIDRLTAALEAFTGIVVTMGAPQPAAEAPPVKVTQPPVEVPKTNGAEPPKRGRGRPPAAAAKPEPEPEPELDDDFGDDLDGDDDTPTQLISPAEARAAVFAYREAAIKWAGDKEKGLSETRKILKSLVASIDEIGPNNAAEVHAAFTKGMSALGKGH